MSHPASRRIITVTGPCCDSHTANSDHRDNRRRTVGNPVQSIVHSLRRDTHQAFPPHLVDRVPTGWRHTRELLSEFTSFQTEVAGSEERSQ